MKTTCPFCDSENIDKITVQDKFRVPFCDDVVIPYETFRCNNCEEEGDFDHTLDRDLTKAVAKANIASAPKLIDELVHQGITMTHFEKALRLPFKTTARWKKGNVSHAALALLRLVRFSPSLLAVADDNFSKEAALRYQASQPIVFFEKYTTNASYTINLEEGDLTLQYCGSLSPMRIATSKPQLSWEQA